MRAGVCPAPCSRVTLASPRRCRYYSSLRLPLMYSHPYSQITVETEFDNPIYETGVSAAGPLAPWGLLRWLGAKGFKGFAARAASGLQGASGQTMSGPGGLQKPWAGQGGDHPGEQRDPWSASCPPGMGCLSQNAAAALKRLFLLFRKPENTKFRYKDGATRVSSCELNVLS